MWCLPKFLLVPEICMEPVGMIFIGGEIWLFLLFLHFAIPFALFGMLFGRD